jgi:4a-hydroxytetrahydrobiopterin dehydratase
MSAFSTSPTHSASDGKGDELFRAACVPCKGNSPAIPPSEYPSYLAQLSPEWRIEPFHGNTCPALQREFRFKNFKNAERLARTIGEIAEEPGVKHHPAIVIEWGKLTCAWWTHAISGVSFYFLSRGGILSAYFNPPL